VIALQVTNLSKSYGFSKALSEVSFDINWGESLAVLGPNGAGKTTLIKMLAMLVKEDAGEIIIDGYDFRLSKLKIWDKIGVVLHQDLLYSHMTVEENLRFFASMFNVKDVDSRIIELANLLGLNQKLSDKVGILSHGYKRRVAIARSIVHDPPIFLMDEPVSGLDNISQEFLEAIISQKIAKSGAVLATTHTLDRVPIWASSVMFLNKGKVVTKENINETSELELKKSYADLFED
jgi:heme exporter protein A